MNTLFRLARVVIGTSFLLWVGFANAAPPKTINYQGYLTNPGGTPVTTPVTLTFRLYDAASGGAALYTEIQPGVVVTNGNFNAAIGTVTPLILAFDVPYWLSVAVNTDLEMSPRQPLASSAYAFRAGSAEALAPGATVSGTQITGAITTATVSASNLIGTIATANVADGAVTSAKLATNAVGPANIAPGSIGRAQVNSFEVQLRVAAMCPRGAPMIGILADGSPICDQPLRTLAFSSDRLTVAVRPDGRPILARGGGNLYDCDNVDCTTGTSRNTNLGSDAAMAVRSDGFPVIAVGGSSNQFLVICNDAACTSRTQRTLDSGQFGTFSGMALRADNTPIVVYFEFSSGVTRLYACNDPTCASGTIRSITTGPSYTPSGVRIRPNGTPVIALRNYVSGGHGLFDCNDAGCSSGTIRALGGGGSIRFLLGLAVRSDNRPLVVNSGPVLHDCNDAACSSLTNRSFDAGEGISASAIAIRSDGRPLLAYATFSNAVKVFDCTDTACSSGSARAIDQLSANFTDTEVSIALRADGRPVIAYVGTFGTVRLLLCATTNCQ
ncbi:MAG: hypothetical protein ABL931_07590 [Usitatibacteraceae bacterium]